ncbi:MAG: membrane-bound lytic murein transglycosylase MltF [Haliea sp.]|jgi:membrane-bound lytic murein transglycosylase F|nr:membrane-bound lytic murein transglycosylase MltF [Haliea sp.]MAL94454.1 membrane-bound lytic murein transglycosylase MltF [Haliea sp.]|tara:strand:- start:32481 stop:33902 length:1422 start_codon:yes stop_codon:yes gene_type:complete
MRSYLALLLFALLLAGCQQRDSLRDILDGGELVVVSRSSPTTFYLGREGPTGFEYDLAQLLAEDLGVELRLEPAFTLTEVLSHLERREAHLAAAGLSLTAERAARFHHSVPYAEISTQVIYRTGQRRPADMDDLGDLRLVVLAGSSHEQTLERLQASTQPGLRWQSLAEADSTELLERVENGEAELAMLDANEFRIQQALYPRLAVAFDLGEIQEMVWYMAPGEPGAALQARVNDLFQRLREEGRLELLKDRHFGHASALSRIGSHTFARSIRTQLPEWRGMIRQVAAEYQLDWRLLAAIAYQESHWDPEATSPTGVRGMMMLTTPTAEEMGVSNRTDPLQSLRGGARYFKQLRRRLPGDIPEPDRTWMALVAYNIGRAHLSDARVLTERMGGDPHRWADLMEYLPLLQKREYYRTTKYGFARGLEAVNYVQNIRHYYSILQWQDQPAEKPSPPLDTREFLPEVLRGVRLQAL